MFAISKNKITAATALLLVAVMCFAGFRIAATEAQYASEADIRNEYWQYRPEASPTADAEMPDAPQFVAELSQANAGVSDARRDLNGDIAGWLALPNTQIDYPFVQAADNDYYLRRDLNGDYALAGSIFMDCASDAAFGGFNMIIYGHHMQNGSMFGSIRGFDNRAFFEENELGAIWLSDATFDLHIFAFLVIEPNETIYGDAKTDEEKSAFLRYVQENARYYRDIDAGIGDSFVTLSTCAYEFRDARMVLLARLEPRLTLSDGCSASLIET